MVAPPPSLAGSVQTIASDRVSLFGASLKVRGSPFYQQDGEFIRCAHAAAWVCHYAGVLREISQRTPIGAFAGLAPPELSAERALPSKGLTQNQLQAVLGRLGQPAIFYGLSLLPNVPGVPEPVPKTDATGQDLPPGLWDTRIFSILCRYLNSGFPVIATNDKHAFTIVGWYKDSDGQIRLIACDDQQGPYEVIDSPFDDLRAPWRALMIPLPPKVYLSGEVAETEAHLLFRGYGQLLEAPPPWKALSEGLKDRSTISLRSVLMRSNRFKSMAGDQSRAPDHVRLIRLAQLPKWIWVVEAHNRELRARGEPSVVAEAVLDSTSSDGDPRLDLLSLPGTARTNPPDSGPEDTARFDVAAWRSVLSFGP